MRFSAINSLFVMQKVKVALTNHALTTRFMCGLVKFDNYTDHDDIQVEMMKDFFF